MTDQIFKTPQNLIKDSLRRKYNRLSESHDSAPVTTTPSEDQEQAVGARRSPRNVGKESVAKKFKLSPKTTYPGSGSKAQGRRSFRTPVQTIPLKTADGKAGHSASKSFAVMPDQAEMETPRTVIEGLMVTAESQPRSHFVALEISQRRTVADVLPRTSRRLSQLDDSASQRTSLSAMESPTPASNLTPRTNVWNLLNNVMNETQAAIVRTEDQSNTLSAESNLSAIKHREWGQVVSLSPLPFADSSDEIEESPVFSKKSLKRNRRSFHIQVPPKKVKASQDGHEEAALIERRVPVLANDPGSNSENLNPVPASDILEKDMSINSDVIASNVPDIAEILLTEAVEEAGGNLAYMSVKEISSLLMEEDDDELVAVEEERADPLRAVVEKENRERLNSLIVSRSSSTEIVLDVIYEKSREGEIENVIQAEVDNNDVDIVNDGNNVDANVNEVNKELIGSGQDKLITQEIPEVRDDVNEDSNFENNVQDGVKRVNNNEAFTALVNVDNRTDNIIGAIGIENIRDAATEDIEELRKDRITMGSRISSFTSRHGEISFSASPRKSPKEQPVAQASSTSVYNLSEESNTSTDIYVPKPTSSHSSKQETPSLSTRKKRRSSLASSEKRRSAKKGLFGGTSSFQNRSTLSYSEWKSLQKDKNYGGQMGISFNEMHPPRSSTPADRRKKVLHSTRLQNSVFAQTPGEQTSEVVPMPDISPIQPALKKLEQKAARGRPERIDADSDKDYDGTEDNPEKGLKSGQEKEMGSHQEVSDDDSLGLSPLATPHIDMDKRSRVTLTGKISSMRRPALGEPSGSGLKKKMGTQGQPKKRGRRPPSSTALPLRSVKFFAERRTTMKLSKDAVEEIAEVSEIFWDNTFKALEAYALHAGRKIINEEDAILLMKTQRLVTDQEDLYDKIREYLPMDQRIELIDLLQTKKTIKS